MVWFPFPLWVLNPCPRPWRCPQLTSFIHSTNIMKSPIYVRDFAKYGNTVVASLPLCNLQPSCGDRHQSNDQTKTYTITNFSKYLYELLCPTAYSQKCTILCHPTSSFLSNSINSINFCFDCLDDKITSSCNNHFVGGWGWWGCDSENQLA